MPIIRWLLKTDDRIGMIQEVTELASGLWKYPPARFLSSSL